MGKKWKVSDFTLGGSKITADGDCNHKIKRHLLLGKEANTNLDSVLKSRDITLPTKIHLVKAIVFSSSHVWMWELDHKESGVLKEWYFQTMELKNTLESPLDSREFKPVNPKHSLEVLVLKLKFWYFGHLTRKTDSLEKTLMMLGKVESKRRRGWQRMRWLDGITDSMDKFEQTAGDSEGPGSLECCSSRGPKESDTTSFSPLSPYDRLPWKSLIRSTIRHQ